MLKMDLFNTRLSVRKSCYFLGMKESNYFCDFKHCVIDNCDNDCRYYNLIYASPAFLNKRDQLFRNAMDIKPIDGFDDLVCHATALYFVNRDIRGNEELITPEEMAHDLKLFYNNKVPNLRLISCNAGVFDNGLAQQMANLLHVKILAAKGIVATMPENKMWVLDPETFNKLNEKEAWKLFIPKEG